jgi:uncharacterized protein YdeI (BOF family)
MGNMKKLLLAAAILFAASNALAQQAGEVANHAVPIGKGPGVQGFGAAAPGAAGTFLGSNGTTTDPSFQSLVFASVAQYYAGVATAVPIAPSIIYPAEVSVPFATSINFDMSTFINAVVVLSGNITSMTVSNVMIGKSGTIRFFVDSAGGHTVAFSGAFKFSGGLVPTVTTTPNSNDILFYTCPTTGFCPATLVKDVR